MGIFQRQLWKQKPQAWGPFSAVQSALFHNAEQMGINPGSIVRAFPFWNPGQQRDYSLNSVNIENTLEYRRNALIAGSSDVIALGDISTSFATEATLLWRFQTNTDASQGFAYIQTSATTSHYPYAGTIYSGTFRSSRVTVGATSIDITNTHNVCITQKPGTDGWNFYQNTNKISSVLGLPTVYIASDSYLHSGNYTGATHYMPGESEFCILFSTALREDQVEQISDNPYQLWQPVPQKTIFLPSEDTSSTTTFTGGTFLRQSWKQKPQAWGPFPAVQSALFHNAEKMGIDPAGIALALPMWNPSDQRDYGFNNYLLAAAAGDYHFNGQGIDFGGDIASGFKTSGTVLNCGNTDPFTLLFDLETDGDSSKSIFAGRHDSNAHYLWARQGTGMYFRCSPSAHTFTEITDFTKRRIYSLSSSGEGSFACTYEYHVDGELISSDPNNDANFSLNSVGSGYSNNNVYALDGRLYQFLIFSLALNTSQIATLSDNPWQLWQPVPQKTIFIPHGDTILPIKLTFNTDEISKGIGPITASQLGGLLVGG